ncbi:unnamed protein product [Pedinophyceae sp. YPF-701]|nr:unnamed protein product [Pedinophyceae sp. YPF-701]
MAPLCGPLVGLRGVDDRGASYTVTLLIEADETNWDQPALAIADTEAVSEVADGEFLERLHGWSVWRFTIEHIKLAHSPRRVQYKILKDANSPEVLATGSLHLPASDKPMDVLSFASSSQAAHEIHPTFQDLPNVVAASPHPCVLVHLGLPCSVASIAERVARDEVVRAWLDSGDEQPSYDVVRAAEGHILAKLADALEWAGRVSGDALSELPVLWVHDRPDEFDGDAVALFRGPRGARFRAAFHRVTSNLLHAGVAQPAPGRLPGAVPIGGGVQIQPWPRGASVRHVAGTPEGRARLSVVASLRPLLRPTEDREDATEELGAYAALTNSRVSVVCAAPSGPQAASDTFSYSYSPLVDASQDVHSILQVGLSPGGAQQGEGAGEAPVPVCYGVRPAEVSVRALVGLRGDAVRCGSLQWCKLSATLAADAGKLGRSIAVQGSRAEGAAVARREGSCWAALAGRRQKVSPKLVPLGRDDLVVQLHGSFDGCNAATDVFLGAAALTGVPASDRRSPASSRATTSTGEVTHINMSGRVSKGRNKLVPLDSAPDDKSHGGTLVLRSAPLSDNSGVLASTATQAVQPVVPRPTGGSS